MPEVLPKVLLVEDQPDDVFIAQAAVTRSRLPVELIVARTGPEALQMLEQANGAHALPSLVLLDMKLPFLDGPDVLQQLREIPGARNVPVVILSNSDENADVARAYRCGANGYVRKACNFSAFCSDIALLLQYWLEPHLTGETGTTLH